MDDEQLKTLDMLRDGVPPVRLADLLAEFDPVDVEWKPVKVDKKTNRGLCVAYVTNRGVMDRLDAVCGVQNWRNTFAPGPDGGVQCGIAIRIAYPDGPQWITKYDGAENSDIEAVKGGFSNAMRRAAVQWGIGRYLYSTPPKWKTLDRYGRIVEQPDNAPSVPAGHPAGPPRQRTRRKPQPRRKTVTPRQQELIASYTDAGGWTIPQVVGMWLFLFPDARERIPPDSETPLRYMSEDEAETLIARMAAKLDEMEGAANADSYV